MICELKTERLMIKPYNHTYLENYFIEFTDEIVKYQYPDSFTDIEAAKNLLSGFLNDMEQGNMLELVILSKEGEFLGGMEAFGIREETPEVGLWLKKSAHGNGYGYEALKALLEYLDATKKYQQYIYEVDVRNTPSIHLAEKFQYKKGDCVEIVTESGKELKLDTYYIISPIMLSFETEHYSFHYHKDSLAEKDLSSIVALQEACFAYICKILQVTPDFKIEYFLCDTPEEVGAYYGDDEPCNGCAKLPNKVYAVYNDKVKCIGFHEDAHIISYCINRPPNSAVREGLAMFFDRKWWGISNHDWTLYYMNFDLYMPIDQIIENDDFFEYDCTITYPIVGAFTEYLILRYGSEKYMEFYRYTEGVKEALLQIYGKSLGVLNEEFVQYTKLFKMDECVTKRIEELLTENT